MYAKVVSEVALIAVNVSADTFYSTPLVYQPALQRLFSITAHQVAYCVRLPALLVLYQILTAHLVYLLWME